VPLERVVAALRDGAVPAEGLHGADARLGAFLATDLVERRSATLVALFEEPPYGAADSATDSPAGGAEGARVVLTVRSTTLRAHRGEVALPGGRLEPWESVEEAALREASEEVGLDPGLVTVVGRLGSLPTVSSNTLMTPVVATLPGRPTLVRGPAEVDRVFDVPLARFLAEGNFREEWWSFDGRPGVDGVPGTPFPVWFYEAAGELVWGATARVLTELLCRTLDLPLPPREPPTAPHRSLRADLPDA
jgi:8-oxo-dGTP pyrophosphatase MutT (NUDIX family)